MSLDYGLSSLTRPRDRLSAQLLRSGPGGCRSRNRVRSTAAGLAQRSPVANTTMTTTPTTTRYTTNGVKVWVRR